jgi:hypothetical protein
MDNGNMSLQVLFTVEAFATLPTEYLCLTVMYNTMLLQGKTVCEGLQEKHFNFLSFLIH